MGVENKREGDFFMDNLETYRRERMKLLEEELKRVEENRKAGAKDWTLDEVEVILQRVIDEA